MRREGKRGRKENKRKCLQGRNVVDIILNNIYNTRLQINVKNKVHQVHNIRILMDDIDCKDI
jgi:hypothetical protein